jgi:3-phenylpropionate/trans-cinnamate dioxygenase ferredoxin subunit
MEWIDVCPVEQLQEGEPQVLYTDDYAIAVFRVGDDHYAVEDVCTHDGGELAGGDVEGCQVICPRHGARFDLKTGAALTPPAYEAIPTFKVRVEGGTVQVSSEPTD